MGIIVASTARIAAYQADPEVGRGAANGARGLHIYVLLRTVIRSGVRKCERGRLRVAAHGTA